MATSTSALGSTPCDQVQLLLIAGERTPDVSSHLGECSECQFFDGLSRNLAGLASRTESDGPLGASFSVALAAALEHGEPILGRYRLEAFLGRGGQAEVYRAVDLETRDIVAVKLVRMHARGEDRTAAEVTHARRVVHPNVCRVFHTERYGAMRLIVMEHLEGPALVARLPLRDRARAVEYFVAIAQAVRAAHAAGILHLDLKPQNVLFRDGVPVVTDFGLSAVEGDARATGGTPAYMAPEQRTGGAVDRRTDIYALGRLLEVLVGAAPGRRLARIIRVATADDPGARYRDVDEMLRAVNGRRRIPRVLAWAVAGAAVLAALLIGLAVLIPPPGQSRQWRSDLWGVDAIPLDAVNVALDPQGDGPVAVHAAPPFACARSTRELVDGVTQYSSWEHGFAFPPAEPICVGLDALAPKGICGELRADAQLCEQLPGGGHRVLETRVAERERLSAAQRARLGQLEPAVPCGERTVTVELEDQHEVIGVRLWVHHPEHAPASFRVEADTPSGRRVVYATQLSHVARRRRDYPATRGSGESAPVTADLPSVNTRRVHIIMDSCTMRELDDTDTPIGNPGHGWLYEVEVFARVSKLGRWWRYLRGT